jgi:hypothetical protein
VKEERKNKKVDTGIEEAIGQRPGFTGTRRAGRLTIEKFPNAPLHTRAGEITVLLDPIQV